MNKIVVIYENIENKKCNFLFLSKKKFKKIFGKKETFNSCKIFSLIKVNCELNVYYIKEGQNIILDLLMDQKKDGLL